MYLQFGMACNWYYSESGKISFAIGFVLFNSMTLTPVPMIFSNATEDHAFPNTSVYADIVQ